MVLRSSFYIVQIWFMENDCYFLPEGFDIFLQKKILESIYYNIELDMQYTFVILHELPV